MSEDYLHLLLLRLIALPYRALLHSRLILLYLSELIGYRFFDLIVAPVFAKYCLSYLQQQGMTTKIKQMNKPSRMPMSVTSCIIFELQKACLSRLSRMSGCL